MPEDRAKIPNLEAELPLALWTSLILSLVTLVSNITLFVNVFRAVSDVT